MRTRWGWIVVAGLYASAGLSAQVRLAGRVVSDTQAPLANATVSVRGESGAPPAVRVLSDPSGAFALQLPSAGEYRLDAEALGYYTLKGRPFTVSGGDHDITITLSPVREFADSVDVTAAPASLALDQTASEKTLAGAELLDIPIPVTHDLKTMMRVLPGIVQDTANGVHVNGGAENQTLYLLDGFNIGDPLTGAFNTRLALEGVQAMNVETGSLASEYGKGSAGVVAIDMKTGDDRFRYSATNFVPGLELNKGVRVGSWYPRVNFSGPVERGRVWFSDSLSSEYAQTVIAELPKGQDSSTSSRYNNFLQVRANLTPANIASFGFLASVWTGTRAGLSALDPVSTTLDDRARQWFAYARDQVYFGHGAVVEFGFASNRTFFRETPQGSAPYVYTPLGRQGNYYVNGTQEASRNQAIANAWLPSFAWLGAHQLKIGTDVDWLDYGQNLRRTSYEWLDANMNLVRRAVFTGNGDVGRTNLETAVYGQDNWRLRPNLLLELGIRSDWDRLLENWTASPRVGLAWSPKVLENTRISAGYAISYDATNLALFVRPRDQTPITYYYPPYGIATQPILSSFRIDRGLHSPRFATWNAAVDRRFGANLFAHVQATRRRGADGLAFVPPPGLAALTEADAVYRLTNARDDFYDALELTLRQNFRREYGWLASYTRSRARSTAVLDLATDTPLLVSSNAGRLAWDAPDRFIGWLYVPAFFRDWAIASSLEYRSGFPFPVENAVGVVLSPVNGWRYPDFFEWNLHLERRFQFHGQRWAGRVGYSNITGHRNPNVVDNIIGAPNFLTYYGGQSRALQFRIRWLGKL